MKFASYKHEGRAIAAAVTGPAVRDLTPLLGEIHSGISPMRRLIDLLGQNALDFSKIGTLPMVPMHELTISPLVPDPGKIVAAPVNYHDHQEEMKQLGDVSALGFFLKAPSSVLADGGTVQIPYLDRRFDQEGELAFVVGKQARHVSVEDALDHMAGFTCLLDITMRGGEDRSTRKSFDTFTPVGPFLVTPDEVGELSGLTLQTRVNGEMRQDADIKDLIWGVPEFLSYVSSVVTLHPGDIVTMGTPAGVGQINNGDIVEVEISGVGALKVAVSDEDAVLCPTSGASSGPQAPQEITPVRQRSGLVRD
ncbi:fumarylacetoacetate hydrolase family protein [Arthrobacter sp. ZGTC212]|uniref:fumarylacetoacetate hydrolase family protein n=1 Tax=Arthrobacter sp. ZGTC212 TaxID=2058899 RepID=UPI000CE5704C|nr:fumarylacetoacetate hydrolase family protein [Arthrobacter sp. ZGTC212]